ncbi:MAG: hypothetical protein K5755_03565 [Clostridiales bacterium]|nr:hypothetical protein [Clostridia bacterium]MCR4563694.1 hypothetical protein [Clostridiales bacterium]
MTVNELVRECSFDVICLADGDREVKGCYIGDLLSWVMGRAREDNAWITIMSNINVVAVASLSDVSCVILAEGVTLDDEVKAVAESKGINVLCSQSPIFETALAVSGKV